MLASPGRLMLSGRMLPGALVVAMMFLPAAAAAAAAVVPTATVTESIGSRLFSGALPLRGKIGAHDEMMPASAVRCANCHRREDTSANPRAATGPAAEAAPALGPQNLLGVIARRGGPPRAYSARSFCQLLRTGVDPAFVVVQRAMPRFDIDDAGCDALWAYLAGSS